MSNLLFALVPPLLLLFSIPLAALALLTTTLAFSTLLVRVLIVYIELALVVAHNQFFRRVPSKTTQPPGKGNLSSSTSGHQRRKSRRSSAGSAGSEQGSITPKAGDTGNFGLITSTGIDRDFEGVGGWRFSGPDEEDPQWTSTNSRLELPAAVGELKRKHNRSLTSGGLSTSRIIGEPYLPDSFSRSTMQSRARTPPTVHIAGPASPEEYFVTQPLSRSTPAFDTANIGKAISHGRTSSSSTLSSGSSNRGLHIQSPTG